MIFSRTKRTAAKVADDLAERGFAAAAIHGDLGQGAREQALRAFRNGKVDVLVATDVAARGIDVEDVTHVINYQCPEDEKTYLHRIGRTGRAGNTGIAVTFVDWDDMPRWGLINKALDLGIPEPEETYSSSDAPLRRPRHPRGHQGPPAQARSRPARAWTPRSSRTSARPGKSAGPRKPAADRGGRTGERRDEGRGGAAARAAAASAAPRAARLATPRAATPSRAAAATAAARAVAEEAGRRPRADPPPRRMPRGP